MINVGPYLDGGLHEDRGGIVDALSTKMQHRRITLLSRACYGFVDLGFTTD